MRLDVVDGIWNQIDQTCRIESSQVTGTDVQRSGILSAHSFQFDDVSDRCEHMG